MTLQCFSFGLMKAPFHYINLYNGSLEQAVIEQELSTMAVEHNWKRRMGTGGSTSLQR